MSIPKPGDWVRFYQSGNLVIGVVQYVRDPDHYPYELVAMCDVGSVGVKYILEIRAAEIRVPDIPGLHDH